MSSITWQESYSVGVPALDDQHKILIDLINQLGQTDCDIRSVMDKLDWYVHEHFALEESMMEDAGYKHSTTHSDEHREFEKWLRAAQSHMASSGMNTALLVSTVHHHLEDWLVGHILVTDMDYKDVLS